MKCIDDEIPFEIPQSWCWVRLNELGFYRKGPFGSSLTKDMFVPYSKSVIKVYEQKNAIQKDYRLGHYYISDTKFNQMQSFVTNPGDIIVSCAGTIGETYQLPDDAPIGIINQALMRVCLYDKSISEYWQMSFDYILLVNSEMKGAGSAIKNIPPFDVLKSLLVPIPPIAEQNRILSQYRILQSKIRAFETLNSDLERLNSTIFEKLKKSILQEAIQGKLVPQDPNDEPASVLLECIKEEKAKLFKEGKLKKKDLVDSVIFKGEDNKYYEKVGSEINCIDDEIPFEIPSNWQWVRLGKVTIVNPRNTISDEMSVGFIPMTNISPGYGNSIECEQRYWKDVKSGFTHIAEGDVAFAKITPCFQNRKSFIAANLPNGFAAGTTELNVLRPYDNTIDTRYLLWFLKSEYFISEAKFKGTAGQQRVVTDYVLNRLFPLPPVKEQIRISNHLEFVIASIMR